MAILMVHQFVAAGKIINNVKNCFLSKQVNKNRKDKRIDCGFKMCQYSWMGDVIQMVKQCTGWTKMKPVWISNSFYEQKRNLKRRFEFISEVDGWNIHRLDYNYLIEKQLDNTLVNNNEYTSSGMFRSILLFLK